MVITINIRLLLVLTFTFIFFTIVGTISHEYGHIMVAKYYGYETTLHYGSMSWNSESNGKLIEIYKENQRAIENNSFFKRKAEYDKLINELQSKSIWITIGGPLQTTLTGTIGFFILLLRRRRIKQYGLKLLDWLAVFLALFWLREVFNPVMSVVGEIVSPKGNYFSGDEAFISYKLNLWEGTISLILGVIGLIVALFVIFKIIPIQSRLTFILSGLLGGIIGFIFWMDILGPILLP